MAIKHFNIHVFGLVQGVSFRYHTKLTADHLGIYGSVRNERNGSVYIEAEGEPAALEKFIAWCHQGPAFSQVERVAVAESADLKNFMDFQIILL